MIIIVITYGTIIGVCCVCLKNTTALDKGQISNEEVEFKFDSANYLSAVVAMAENNEKNKNK